MWAMTALRRDFLNLRLRVGAPGKTEDRSVFSLALDLKLTPVDVVIAGAVAATIVWIAKRPKERANREQLEGAKELPLGRHVAKRTSGG